MITLPFNDLDKQKILEKLALKFKLNKEYTEREVNNIIKSFDVDDHALFRRELINFGYMSRDILKGVYILNKHKLSADELEKIKSRQECMKKNDVF